MPDRSIVPQTPETDPFPPGTPVRLRFPPYKVGHVERRLADGSLLVRCEGEAGRRSTHVCADNEVIRER